MIIEGNKIIINFLYIFLILLERCYEIEKANKILLDKMTSILTG
jgi:hypothetical protein